MLKYSRSGLGRSIGSKIFSMLFFAACICAMLIYFTTNIQVERKEIISANIPRNFHNLTVVYASDFLYDGGNTLYIDNVISKINSYRADVVVLGGNYGNCYNNSLKFFDVIPNIHSNMGVFAVLGENDILPNKNDNYSLNRRMSKKNIRLLVNDRTYIKNNGESICVCGLDDVKNGNPDYSLLNPTPENDFTIFACNSAKAVNKIIELMNSDIREYITDIALFGSTLGGQYIFNEKLQKIINPINSPKYFTGWHGNSKNNILVSNGVGARNPGFRFGILPQIHVINIKYR